MAKFIGTETMSVDKPEVLDDIQPRKRLIEEAISDYAEVYKTDPSLMPALRVFKVGRREVLTRGFHRITAMRRAEVKEMTVERWQGTMEEAKLDALQDNRSHGIRYSRDDKKVIVHRLIADPKHKQTTIARLAEITGFSRPFIASICRMMERREEAHVEDVEDIDEVEESYEGEESLGDLNPSDRMRVFNKAVDNACREVQGLWRRVVKPLGDRHAWLRDAARLTTASQQLSSALATLRSCKGHGICPKCDGEGCKVCRHTGFLDKSTSEAANFS